MSITVRYIYSACVVIETPDLTLLCDPWFTDGVYDGSWYQFPKLDDPTAKIGKVDAIYISHIHPDHYDPIFIRDYLAVHGDVQLLIGDYSFNHLKNKMRVDGFAATTIREHEFGGTKINIVVNDYDNSPNSIDSALIVQTEGHGVINMNDCLYDDRHIAEIHAICPEPDLALLGYTGAGPYPQTYYDMGADLEDAAEQKKREFFQRYEAMKAALGPKKAIPFAGKYILGGRLCHLNEFRGVADAFEVTHFDDDAVVLDDGGDAWISTSDLRPSRIRKAPYSIERIKQRYDEIERRPMAYEDYFGSLPETVIPIMRHMPKCYQSAIEKSECTSDHYYCIPVRERWIVMNANRDNPSYTVASQTADIRPRSEIQIDPRYLFGLMTGVFHWNNAVVGSQFFTRRVPDEFDRKAQNFLNFLCL